MLQKNYVKQRQKCSFEAPFMQTKATMIFTPMKDAEYGFADEHIRENILKLEVIWKIQCTPVLKHTIMILILQPEYQNAEP